MKEHEERIIDGRDEDDFLSVFEELYSSPIDSEIKEDESGATKEDIEAYMNKGTLDGEYARMLAELHQKKSNGINQDKFPESKYNLENTSADALQTGVKNHEGAPAFQRSLEERTVQLLTTNTLESTFYASKQQIKTETIDTLKAMATQDPEFLAKALVYARDEGMLQAAPILGLAILSTAEDKSYFEKAFPLIVNTPDNLVKFIEHCKSGEFRKGFGGVASKQAKEWLRNLSEFQAIKYSGNHPSTTRDGKVNKNNYSLRDLINLARPKPKDIASEERFAWLVQRHNNPELLQNNPRIKAYEEYKKAQTDEERVEIIKRGGLPWEVVIPSSPKMSIRIRQALVEQMPYMALLRNINNLSKRGLLQSEIGVQYLCERLTDKEAIKKAKILPFRFFNAYKTYSKEEFKVDSYYGFGSFNEADSRKENDPEVDPKIVAALEEALELSFENLPEMNGTIAIGSDVSGSMHGPINPKSKTRYIDICSVFTGALMKKASGTVIPLPFNDHVVDCRLSKDDKIMETARKVARLESGSTALGAPIEKLLLEQTSVDTFIGITDNEDWAYGSSWNTGESFLKLWRKYRENVNPEAQAFLIRIDPYNHAVAPQEEPGIHFIYGWNDQVPTYISKTIEGKENQVQKVKSIEL